MTENTMTLAALLEKTGGIPGCGDDHCIMRGLGR
jgi:hypothetical protein